MPISKEIIGRSVNRPNAIEIFGRSVTIVEDDSGDSCWHCALNDIFSYD